jgi:hypothetical protein
MQSAGKQRYIRTKMVLPVRLCCESADDCSPEPAFAHTVDISPVGAQLGGFRISLQPGATIVLQHRHSKGSFRVIWTKQIGPAELRAGVEWVAIEKSVGTEINFWGLELPTHASSASSLATWLRQFE